MGSSKVWRTGRWFWSCIHENLHSSWKDKEACSAQSNNTFSTEEEAKKAGYKHGAKTGHFVVCSRINKTR